MAVQIKTKSMKTKPTAQPKPRGFAAIHPDYQRKIARKGGKTVFKIHGSKHMADIGAKGGMNSHRGDGLKKNKP